MNLEKKLSDALYSGNRKKIEKIFSLIYDKYYKLVYYVIKTNINNIENIKDVSQNTFLHFFNSLTQNSKINDIKSYLLTIAKNESINFLKKYNNYIEFNEEINSIETDNSNNDIFDELSELLTKEEYDILIEHIIYGKKLSVIAKEKNVNKNSLKSTYHRSIQRIKTKYGGQYEK